MVNELHKRAPKWHFLLDHVIYLTPLLFPILSYFLLFISIISFGRITEMVYSFNNTRHFLSSICLLDFLHLCCKPNFCFDLAFHLILFSFAPVFVLLALSVAEVDRPGLPRGPYTNINLVINNRDDGDVLGGGIDYSTPLTFLTQSLVSQQKQN